MGGAAFGKAIGAERTAMASGRAIRRTDCFPDRQRGVPGAREAFARGRCLDRQRPCHHIQTINSRRSHLGLKI